MVAMVTIRGRGRGRGGNKGNAAGWRYVRLGRGQLGEHKALRVVHVMHFGGIARVCEGQGAKHHVEEQLLVLAFPGMRL